MKRRQLLQASAALPLTLVSSGVFAQDKWGQGKGYPTGLQGGLNRDPIYRVGNYSGGFEKIFPHNTIKAPIQPADPYTDKPASLVYRTGFSERTPEDYLKSWPITGLLIARGNDLLFERYQYERTAQMRLTSWSMAKSITSLLLGICLDLKLIDSYDDPAEKYVPSLKGTLHGGISLRNLSNMSSGADVLHDRDNPFIYPWAFMSPSANIANTVGGWNRRREDPGTLYNYNELCPLTLGMVIRQVSGMSMAAFAEKVLWQPMGPEADATWSTDSEGKEFNCIGFSARLRDWARLGRLVAQVGSVGGKQVVSEAWINECIHWSELDRQCRYGVAGPWFGYKAHMWHSKPDGSRLYFNGHHAQRVLIDMPTQTVLVQTAVDHAGPWQRELFDLFDAATRA
ncbi:MAG: serine hydrolase domain-containing protein [Betaproteobacteria bacterium]